MTALLAIRTTTTTATTVATATTPATPANTALSLIKPSAATITAATATPRPATTRHATALLEWLTAKGVAHARARVQDDLTAIAAGLLSLAARAGTLPAGVAVERVKERVNKG